MKVLSCILLVVFGYKVAAQESPALIDPLKHSPSPTAAQLGRYGDIPVALFTGTPEVNVPLYELKTQHLSLPISLNYRSSGLKVDKIASQVGFDWSLFAGGVITRIVRGYPDDSFRYSRILYPIDPDKTPTTQDYQEIKSHLFSHINSTVDFEPDSYSFFFGGYSGTFYIKPDDDYIGNNDEIITVPYQNLKIQQPNKSLPFTITTPDGVVYEFQRRELTGESIDASVTAYFLNKIVHPFGDEIRFYYKPSGIYRYKTAINENFVKSVVDDLDITCEYEFPVPSYAEASKSRVTTVVLDSIVATGYGKVIFQTEDDRLDVPELRIKGLEIFNSRNEKVKSIVLSHHFAKATMYPVNMDNVDHTGTDEDNTYRMFLDSVLFQDTQSKTIEKYSFKYKDLHDLPVRLSYARDHWGYFNGANNHTLLITSQVPEPYKSWYIGTPNVPDADRQPHSEFSQKGMLTQVRYPTGGYTTFEYEPHETTSTFGGVRLERQKNFSERGIQLSSKRYEYDGGESGPPVPTYFVSFDVPVPCTVSGGEGGSPVPVEDLYHVYWLRSNPIYQAAMSSNYDIGYQAVSIFREGPIDAGWETHHFVPSRDLFTPYALYGNVLYDPPLSNLGWKAGTKWMETYRNSDSQLVKSVEYIYNEDPRKEETNSFVQIQYLHNVIVTGSFPPPRQMEVGEAFNVLKYSIISKWNYLDSVITKEWDVNGQNPITTSRKFIYENENHAQLTRERTRTSTGDVLENRYYYPQDYNPVGNFNTLINTKFITNKPVDVRTYKGNRLISGYQTKYNDLGQPTDIYQTELNATTTDIPFDAGNPFTFSHKLTYHYRDNLLSESLPDNNFPTTYIWSYDKTLPIGKIDNCRFQELETAVSNLGTNFLAQLSDLNDQATIDQNVSLLRNEINNDLPGKFLTTFTHTPLIGIQSVTDPNDRMMHYQYDSYGRLKSVLDHDLNIVKAVKYNYIDLSKLPRLEVSDASPFFAYGSTAQSIDIRSNVNWEATADQSWIHLSTQAGNGNAAITVTVDENPQFTIRSGTITISPIGNSELDDIIITIRQNKHPGYLQLTPSNLLFPYTANTKTFQINSSVSWEILNAPAWVSLSSISGSANTTVSVTVNENTNFSSRTHQFIVRDVSGNGSPDQIVTLNQAGKPSFIDLSTGELNFSTTGGTQTFGISANVPWSLSEAYNWMSISPSTGTGNGTITVTVAANTASDARTGVIYINDQSGAGNTRYLSVIQPGTQDYITVSPLGFNFNTSTMEGSFNIQSNLSLWYTRINYLNGSDWIDELHPTNGSGNRTGIDVFVNQLPPGGETWQAEIEVYNEAKGLSATIFVNLAR